MSRSEIKYSTENSSCPIKWAAYLHTRGRTLTVLGLTLQYLDTYSLYSGSYFCRHNTPQNYWHAIPRDTSDSQAVHLERHQVPSEPYRSHWEKSIRLSLHDYLHAAYPHSHLPQPPRPSRQNVQTSKYHFDAMSHQQSCIFILHRETSKYNSIFMIQRYQNTTVTSSTIYRNIHCSHPNSTSSMPFWPFCLAVRPLGAQSLRQFDLGSLGPQDCAPLVLTASPIFPRVIVLDLSNLLT